MKETKLREIIREEIQKLNERKLPRHVPQTTAALQRIIGLLPSNNKMSIHIDDGVFFLDGKDYTDKVVQSINDNGLSKRTAYSAWADDWMGDYVIYFK